MSGSASIVSAPEKTSSGAPTATTWIARHALGWLLAAQLALIAPHLRRLPLWLALAWFICAFWRVMVFQGRWSLPHRGIKLALIVLGLAGIRFSYGSWVGLEPTVALLIAGFSFKLIEATSRRDAYLLLFLGYFVALTEFLFEQGLGTVLYMLLPILLLTSALVALQEQEPLRLDMQPLRKAALLALQSLPLMLLLFLVFPRLAPLWQVPLPGAGKATTGMSDHLVLGDISELSQSDALAFRVQFQGAVPPRPELYWRVLVLDSFDGRAWTAGPDSERPIGKTRAPAGAALDYEVYLEPTQRRWLVALSRPADIDAKTMLTLNYQLLARHPVFEKFYYRARVWPQAPLDDDLGGWRRHYFLKLPKDSNPRARAFAREARAASASDSAFIEKILRDFHQQPFVYTLKPPRLGAQGIDEFLFDNRRGFCEHYASAFTFLMRAAGIPARVVTGYQGGEINPRNGSVALHQFDAHAWAEVWLEGRGWVRFDPTAAVAPERIESGLENALAPGEFLGESPFSAQRYRQLGWLNTMRLNLDSLNYWWTRWVLSYHGETQTDVLQRLLGEINPLRVGVLLLGGGALALGVLALWLLKGGASPRPAPEVRLYQRFCRQLARRGYPRPEGMAPRDYAGWLRGRTTGVRHIDEITDCFEALSYRDLQAEQRRRVLGRMRRLVGSM